LYALISTPGVVALLYNRVAFERNADALRAKGLDPTRPPTSIAELDAYAEALTKIGPAGRIERMGYLPLEPGWYLPYTPFWFGGSIWDEQEKRITLTDPKVVAAYDWVASYSRKYGAAETLAFRSASGAGSNWDSPQEPFTAETVMMMQNGPWMADHFERYVPDKQRLLWTKEQERTQSPEERKKNYFWAAAAFPSATGEPDVSYCTSDVIAIPRGARHKREAFEFMAYLNRQDVMERLCRKHCKNSPLRSVSEGFVRDHPNPYIDVFERLAASPNARSVPQCPILKEVNDELTAVAQSITLLETDAISALQRAQERLDAKFALFVELQAQRQRNDVNEQSK
jgi:ABC-type glycerol-3-phosphate transport system substrate-binding protein